MHGIRPVSYTHLHAIANLAKQPVPDVVNEAYHVNNFTFGPEYFIPKPVDPRLMTEVSCAVAKAAMDSGVARKHIACLLYTSRCV